jgi:hypothetical protein
MENKSELKNKITNYLLEVDPKPLIGAFIHAALNHEWNFDQTLEVLKEQYQDNPKAMTQLIGEVPMRLILSY